MYRLPKTLYTIAQIREFEHLAAVEYDISEDEMMERAGYAAFKTMMTYWPKVSNICVVTGTGNNAGDGYILARIAKQHGKTVTIAQVGELESVCGPALNALKQCYRQEIEVHPFRLEFLKDADIIVDALMGIGANGVVRPIQSAIIHLINDSQKPVLAIDVPSGLCADTGNALGEVIVADVTISFIGLKQGLLTHDGVEYCGHLLLDDLDFPLELKTRIKPAALRLEYDDFKSLLAPRHRNTHKGYYGHVLLIGGDYGFAGAITLAAEAALRVGAGLVTVATRPEHVAMIITNRPEIMCVGIEKIEQLIPLYEKTSVQVVGPGLGYSNWSHALWEFALAHPMPTVLDADGLNWLATFPRASDQWILTPHPGEAARLLKAETISVQANRFEAIKAIQSFYRGICVLKGAGSIVKGIDAMNRICTAGNPGMASGGMGDILSGVIGGLLAQGLSLVEAARLGVLLHAMAADLAAKSGQRGMIATDLLPHLRTLVNPE